MKNFTDKMFTISLILIWIPFFGFLYMDWIIYKDIDKFNKIFIKWCVYQVFCLVVVLLLPHP